MYWRRRIFSLNYILILELKVSMQDISLKLKEFIKNEKRSCSMDIGGITPVYVYRMWGGSVAIEEIEKAMAELRSHRNHR